MTARRWIADTLIEAIDAGARNLGPRFYQLYLDHLNRRHHDEAAVVACSVPKGTLRFHAPNRRTAWRAETLLTKEPGTIEWIDGFEDESVLWDVGANVGIYTIYAAFSRRCRVLAFEPGPSNFEILCRNTSLNRKEGSIAAFCVALASERKIGALDVPDPTPGAAYARFAPDMEGPRQTSCLGYSIDRFIEDFDAAFPNYIKIDVDGTEEEVVLGARKTLRDPRLRSVLIELDARDEARNALVIKIVSESGLLPVARFKSPLYPDSPAVNVRFARART
jgi:FkbM family methyltransferase